MAITDYISGLQHLGLPTKAYDETMKFYESLGFKLVYETTNGADRVAFLEQKGLVIETYDSQEAAGCPGAVEHVALDVKNIDQLFEEVKSADYQLVTPEIEFLDFFDNGVKYFKITGPNGEVIEFCEKL